MIYIHTETYNGPDCYDAKTITDAIYQTFWLQDGWIKHLPNGSGQMVFLEQFKAFEDLKQRVTFIIDCDRVRDGTVNPCACDSLFVCISKSPYIRGSNNFKHKTKYYLTDENKLFMESCTFKIRREDNTEVNWIFPELEDCW